MNYLHYMAVFMLCLSANTYGINPLGPNTLDDEISNRINKIPNGIGIAGPLTIEEKKRLMEEFFSQLKEGNSRNGISSDNSPLSIDGDSSNNSPQPSAESPVYGGPGTADTLIDVPQPDSSSAFSPNPGTSDSNPFDEAASRVRQNPKYTVPEKQYLYRLIELERNKQRQRNIQLQWDIDRINQSLEAAANAQDPELLEPTQESNDEPKVISTPPTHGMMAPEDEKEVLNKGKPGTTKNVTDESKNKKVIVDEDKAAVQSAMEEAEELLSDKNASLEELEDSLTNLVESMPPMGSEPNSMVAQRMLKNLDSRPMPSPVKKPQLIKTVSLPYKSPSKVFSALDSKMKDLFEKDTLQKIFQENWKKDLKNKKSETQADENELDFLADFIFEESLDKSPENAPTEESISVFSQNKQQASKTRISLGGRVSKNLISGLLDAIRTKRALRHERLAQKKQTSSSKIPVVGKKAERKPASHSQVQLMAASLKSNHSDLFQEMFGIPIPTVLWWSLIVLGFSALLAFARKVFFS